MSTSDQAVSDFGNVPFRLTVVFQLARQVLPIIDLFATVKYQVLCIAILLKRWIIQSCCSGVNILSP
ncbi:MAG: hypothetical protein LKE47_10560 [Prevotella sp.]|nr:hypothetical protein [Prevotella sp.]MCH3970795.1 hypothetical protein [Prevotella sp.]